MDESWVRAVNAVVRGEAQGFRFIRLGPTPAGLRKFGMLPADLVMSATKVARVRRDHPDVSFEALHALPELIRNPLAVFPSIRRDGSVVLVLVVRSAFGDPLVGVVIPDAVAGRNVVLSVYAKDNGHAWASTQLAYARQEGLEVYESEGFAASVPKPGSASEDTIPSSRGLIPVDGTAKPERAILTFRKKSTSD